MSKTMWAHLKTIISEHCPADNKPRFYVVARQGWVFLFFNICKQIFQGLPISDYPHGYLIGEGGDGSLESLIAHTVKMRQCCKSFDDVFLLRYQDGDISLEEDD